MFPGRSEPLNPPVTTLPLNSTFSSLGEAIYHWANSNGYQPGKRLDMECVAAFCRSLELPIASFNTSHVRSHKQYFPRTMWLQEFVDAHGFTRIGIADYVKVDEHYRPIAMISAEPSSRSNLDVSYNGIESLASALRETALANLMLDETTGMEPDFINIDEIDDRDQLHYSRNSIRRERSTEPKYYPYLDGGITTLIKTFLESDESVMVLIGPPGTGKSSAVIGAITELNLLPIYATKPEVVMHKKFVSKMFDLSDQHMARLAESFEARRKKMFVESELLDAELALHKPFLENDELGAKVPVLVVEDADLLLAPRSAGNHSMAQLLNETDGVTSNTVRKIIFTTNLSSEKDIEQALIRPGRCFGVFPFRLLKPEEAIVARAASGQPPFDPVPTKDVSLAETLRKPRKRLILDNNRLGLGFVK